MLPINTVQLERANSWTSVLVLTAERDCPVDPGTTIGLAKCAPLFLTESTLLAVENLALTAGPVMEVEVFERWRVAFIAPRERLRGGAFDRAQLALSVALEWYGSLLTEVASADTSLLPIVGLVQRTLVAGKLLDVVRRPIVDDAVRLSMLATLGVLLLSLVFGRSRWC